ncbi:MAG TPA: SMR family transporter [Hyphomicrobiaceae bacterium]|jgi:drug/metabolite transporter (DMT)-like permease|nr:SMR family transporter [Hyphomicrobiaceae bacterium]
MRRSTLLLGFLLLVAIDTFVQIGFKLAGNNTLPVTLDLPWLERVVREPWLIGVLLGYGAAFLVYMTLIKHAPIGPAFAASHMEIVTVTLFSVYVFGDTITLWQVVGCCAIVTGVLVLAATEGHS